MRIATEDAPRHDGIGHADRIIRVKENAKKKTSNCKIDKPCSSDNCEKVAVFMPRVGMRSVMKCVNSL